MHTGAMWWYQFSMNVTSVVIYIEINYNSLNGLITNESKLESIYLVKLSVFTLITIHWVCYLLLVGFTLWSNMINVIS